MKSKPLIAIAVASTLGWSAGAIAGSSHEVMTPMSVNESGPVLVSHDQGFGHEPSSSFATSSSEQTIFGSPLSDSSDWTGSVEQVAMADDSSYDYVIALTPVMIESWDYYIIDSDPLALSDDSMSGELAMSELSSDELALGEGDYLPTGSLQEDRVAQVLTDNPIEDTANVG